MLRIFASSNCKSIGRSLCSTNRPKWLINAKGMSFFSTTSSSEASPRLRLPNDGLTLHDFVLSPPHPQPHNASRLIDKSSTRSPTFFIKTYGCQMNVNDTDIIKSLLASAGYHESRIESEADCILTNTCAIRDKAEQKVWHRLRELRATIGSTSSTSKNPRRRSSSSKKKAIVGVLGCMAERLKTQLLQDGMADVVVGPDHYRDLPRLLDRLLLTEVEDQDYCRMHSDLDEDSSPTSEEEEAHMIPNMGVPGSVSVTWSSSSGTAVTSPSRHRRLETYDGILPAHEPSRISSFVSIQRGCSNHCSFCIVPHVRGPERSRPLPSILDEIRTLIFDHGVKEITLLGQNVNSYHDTTSAASSSSYRLSNDGFRSRIQRPDGGLWFADLLHAVADLSKEVRVRFTSPHPKDYPPALLELMAERPNICKQLHLPAQSGSTSVLDRMKRGYTREAYLELAETVRSRIPDVALSTDMIAGFCHETDFEHQDSVSLLEQVQYEQAFLFAYSRREPTHAARRYEDNVPKEVKQTRLQHLIDVFHRHVQMQNNKEVGRLRLVLVEGPATKQKGHARMQWTGRTDQNKRILFPVNEAVSCWNHAALEPLFRSIACSATANSSSEPRIRGHPVNHHDYYRKPADEYYLPAAASESSVSSLRPGDYAVVHVTEAKGPALRGKLLWKTSLQDFEESGLGSPASIDRALVLQTWFSTSISQDEQEDVAGSY